NRTHSSRVRAKHPRGLQQLNPEPYARVTKMSAIRPANWLSGRLRIITRASVHFGAALATGGITLANQRVRLIATAGAIILTAACGGGSSPTASSSPTGPSTAPANKWSISGSVVDTASRESVSGAMVKPAWNLAAVSTGATGDYLLGSTGNP